MKSLQTLDEQYIEFRDKSSEIFSQYPLLEPLRFFIFRDLYVQKRALTAIDFAKHWLRPFFRKAHILLPQERCDVLIWIETSREVFVDALLPVYRELVSRDVKVQLVSFGGPKDLPPGTLKFCFPAASRPPDWTQNAWEHLCDVLKGLHNWPLEKSFRYACANTQSLLKECERMLRVAAPKLVLTASANLEGGAALILASRSAGAMTLLLQHGILQPFYTPVVADYMLTWGQSSNDTLSKLGVPTQRLMSLGSPRHDVLAPTLSGDPKGIFRRALSLPQRPTFVFFSNGNDLVRNGVAPFECAKWLEAIAIQYSSVMNVVVRLHPNEDGSLYRDCHHIRIFKNSPDLATTLDGCDCVGSVCSTVLYDALLYHKPVWQFSASGWPELAENWKSGLATRIASQAELSEKIAELINGTCEFKIEDASDRVFSNHRHAAQAIADFVQGRLQNCTLLL